MFYRIADADVTRCWMSLQRLAEKRVAEIRETARDFFEKRDKMEPISMDELRERLKKNDIVVIDVRPRREYESGHIPGAISIPLPKLESNLDKLPRDRDIVAYCRGPYCVLSAEAMLILNKAGFRAIRLKEGLPEWKDAGLPVEQFNKE